jgi:hypothetical protein
MRLTSVSYLLAASWISCALFMLEIYLVSQYFQIPSRPLLQRIGVGTMFAFDTTCTMAICVNVYVSVLAVPCSPYYFTDFSLYILAVILFATYATASIEQLFLCYLYCSLWVALPD